jgi:hypothetical protein
MNPTGTKQTPGPFQNVACTDEVVRDRHRPVCPFDARYETRFVPGCNRSKALQKLDEILLLPLSQS